MELEVTNLKKAYPNKSVLEGISFKLQNNEIVGLLGRNGCGKSTLMKCITDLAGFNEGQILFDGRMLEPALMESIAYLPEQSAIDTNWTGNQAISFYQDFYSDFDGHKAAKLANEMTIPLDQELKKLSKGMQEKLQLILILSRKAKLYLLDEPLSGVDPQSRDQILDLILSQFDQEATILVSTHLVADIERILDRVLVMKEGQIFIDEPVEDLRNRMKMSVDAFVRSGGLL